MPYAVLELGFLLAQVFHLLHKVASYGETAHMTPRNCKGRRERLLLRPRHKSWK